MRFLLKISYAFQQCKSFENRLKFDKVAGSLKVGTFLRHSVEENANDLHVKCTDFNSCMRVTVYAECICVCGKTRYFKRRKYQNL